MIKAIIFDLDGTILDSIDAWWRAFNDGVAAFNLEPVPIESLMQFMNQGARLADILRGLYPALGTEAGSAMVDDIMAEIRKRYSTNSGVQEELADGAVELLNLVKQRGLKIGVVTSRSVVPERQWRELVELEVAHFIDTVVTAAGSRRKPAPDTVIECLERFGVLPEECIIVGDSLADVMAGKAAGVGTVAVPTGVADLQTLAAESPDFIFDNLHSLIGKLDVVLDR